MIDVVWAILPVFLLIFLGTALRRAGFPGAAFWDAAEKLTYYALLPALLVVTLARAPLADLPVWSMAGAIMLSLLALAAVLAGLRRLLGIPGPAYSSLVQGTLRLNSYIGLAGSFALYGAPGLAAAAVAVAAFVPLVNLLSVAVLARHGTRGARGLAGTLAAILGNPLILACALGILLNAGGLGLPPVLGPMLEILGRGALPLGLLAVGAALEPAGLRGHGATVALAALLKLAVLPAVTALACWALGVTGVAAAVAVLFNGLPAATSAYILARQMGGDAPLMAGIIAVQTALAMASLPLALGLLL